MKNHHHQWVLERVFGGGMPFHTSTVPIREETQESANLFSGSWISTSVPVLSIVSYIQSKCTMIMPEIGCFLSRSHYACFWHVKNFATRSTLMTNCTRSRSLYAQHSWRTVLHSIPISVRSTLMTNCTTLDPDLCTLNTHDELYYTRSRSLYAQHSWRTVLHSIPISVRSTLMTNCTTLDPDLCTLIEDQTAFLPHSVLFHHSPRALCKRSEIWAWCDGVLRVIQMDI